MNGYSKAFLAAIGLFVVGLIGSSQGGCDFVPSDGAVETGTLKMLITDKPFPFEFIAEASVTITRVEVRAADDSGEGDTGEAGDNDNEDEGEDNANENEDGGDDADENENDNGDEADENENENDNADADDNENDNAAGDESDNANDNDADEDNDNANDNTGDDGDENENDNEAEEDEGAGGEEGEGDDEDTDGGFQIVLNQEATFDLLDLQNGITASLLESPLQAGTYTQMRLIVSSGKVVLTDGREFELNVPSGEQTGIKLHFQFDIEADTDTTLLLDVDLSKAFKPVPGGQIDDPSQIMMFQFSPSLAVRVTEVEQTGSISGVVQDEQGNALASVSVTAFLNGEEITTTSTTAEGTFGLAGLEAGDYVVEFSLNGYQDQELPALTVAVGQDSAAGEVTLVAEIAGP